MQTCGCWFHSYCETELRKVDFPISAVTAGGSQDAPDGGIDVRVSLPANTNISGFIPRSATGFQVKKPKMPRSEILKEMCPNGELREVIKELAEVSGAYIIVSSADSTTDSTLKSRMTAMQEAVSGAVGGADLHLDFYDKDQIARWVRYHAGLVVWVRERTSMPIHGWQPYANWSALGESLDSEYLIDEKSCFIDEQNPSDGSLTILRE